MDYILPTPRTGRLWKTKADFFKPFRTAASEVGENITPLHDPDLTHPVDQEEPDLRELNASLAALVDIFPDVQPEVFREMLSSISKESRLQVVTEQLLKKKAKYVNGRFRVVKQKETSSKAVLSIRDVDNGSSLPVEETFRGESYRQAVKQVLYQEFRNLSHSAIRGVMAEHNYSYTLSRPTLQQLASKSWRINIAALWTRRSAPSAAVDHPYLVWQTESSTDAVPAVKKTGSITLDNELHALLVTPILAERKSSQLKADQSLAYALGEQEAEEAEAMFDCECCFSSVPFEQIAHCDGLCHYLCFECIRRATNEAVYGQGWARSVDLEKTTLRCFASSNQECHGALPADLVSHALRIEFGNDDIWLEFQKRAASEVLTKSRIPLQRCPFCVYAEVSETPVPTFRNAHQIWHHFLTKSPPGFQLAFFILALVSLTMIVPACLLASLFYLLANMFSSVQQILTTSWSRVHARRQSPKFHCRNPTCSATTCTICSAVWRDPHTCFESEKTSLRTAIEASATNAVKRTCPKCLLSFVKASGCNKLVCNCGYTMCYTCRAEITTKEGYSHFCQHFRPGGGTCSECDRCDLYGDEDEEGAIKEAVKKAEGVWREEGGEVGNEKATRAMVDALVGKKKGRWWENWLDAGVDAVVA